MGNIVTDIHFKRLKMNFKDLIGKTIIDAKQKKHKEYDDKGYLELTFSDGSKVVIVGSYNGSWTGNSYNEFQTDIELKTDITDQLED